MKFCHITITAYVQQEWCVHALIATYSYSYCVDK